MSSPRVAIIIYSMYGHIAKLAMAEKAGIEKAGGKADILQVPETLAKEVLDKMNAPAKSDFPIATPDDLPNYDAYLFGVPTRYGNFPAQWKAFWDATGQLWVAGSLAGKYAGMFVSTASLGACPHSPITGLSSFLSGYAHAFDLQNNLEEVHGGSPWGAGTIAGGTGARQPSELELECAKRQGTAFWNIVSKVKFD
ncbi:NADH-quinone oxidoreductase [Coprinellus micaceus]|uniref:NADH-quinone oxidoreductase n=1 Tax=Coprinellus micaceus TaxID=71717 RepID=A0A4Y7TAV2_COPMI|nr:NADH-quinone oxidoreductase [Coprinellus micaceus]